jgi:inosine/xanthosine triphosphate pyrophosphatase family protein
MTLIGITYVTSSSFKKEENRIFLAECQLEDGTPVRDVFVFEITELAIRESLEVDIAVMVTEEVKAAYQVLKVPCIVEHAGLIFNDYRVSGYPGGLTKPMWNTLSTSFIRETHSAGRAAIAQAVVAYCDGKRVHTFVGETNGAISTEPRGSRAFYWDTVFIPQDDNPDKLTYAEIVDRADLGLEYKVSRLSQSTKAMKNFLEWRRNNEPELWDVTF